MGHLSMQSLAWGSSEIDWCEANYKITSSVAEFWNTISNALFFIIPPVLVYLFRPYARRISRGVNVVWALLVVVGLGSVYFHSTLSLMGQLLDEIAIIWVFMAALGLWYPKRYMPAIFHRSRQWFQAFMLSLSLFTSCLALISPAINSIVLFILGIPATTLLVLELKRCGSQRVYNMGVRCGFMWLVALSSWISDRLFCHFWEMIHFPYMHCFWHILIFLASSHCCILFAYFDAKEEVPDANPRLRFWPCDDYDLCGIPYISFHPLEPSKLEQKIY